MNESDKQAIEAKAITKAEADKKYPMKGGAYPSRPARSYISVGNCYESVSAA